MARKGHGFLRGALIALAVVILAIIAAVILVPKDALRDRVLAQIEQQTGRTVTVGKVGLRVLPTPRLTLQDLKIGEPATGPRSRVTVPRLDLQARLWPLLKRRLEVTRVLIDEPLVEVFVEQPAAGAGALQSSAAGTLLPAGAVARSASPARVGGPPPVNIQIRELQIQGGRVRVYAQSGEPFVVLGGLSEQFAAEVTTAGLVQLRGETKVDTVRVHLPAGTLGRDLTLRLQKDLSFDTTRDLLSITTATLSLGDLPVAVTGQITGLTANAPAADLHLSGGPASVASILGYLPDTMFPAIEGMRSEGILELSAELRGPLAPPAGAQPLSPEALPDFVCNLTLTHGRIQHPLLPGPVEDIALALHADRDTVEVAEFAARSGSSRLSARATVTQYLVSPQLVLGLDADVDLADVSALQAKPDSLRLTGRATAQLVVSGPTQPPDALVPVGTIRIVNASAQGLLLPAPVSSASGTLTLRGQDLTADALSAQVGRSDVRVDGRLTNYRALDPRAKSTKPARITAQVRGRLLDLDEFIPPPGEASRARAGATGARATPAAMLALVEGTLGVQVDEIRVNHAVIRNARGTIGVDRGLFNFNGVTAEAFGGRLGAQGSLDYRKLERPHFDLQMQVQEAQAAELYNYAADLNRFARLGGFLSGALSATARLSGDLNDSLSLDLGTFASNGNLQMQNGSLANHPLQASLAEFLKAPQLATLAISDWLQPFSIQAGRLVIDGMSLKAGPIEVGATGWQALDGSVGIALDLILPQELAAGIRSQVPAELASILFGGAGERVALPLEISGKMPKPKVSLNAEKLRAGAQQRVEQRLAQERERLQQEARRRADEFLKGLTPTPGDTAEQEAEPQEQEVEKQVKDLLKGILKKK